MSSGSDHAGYCYYYCCYCCSGYASACCFDRFSCRAFDPALKLPCLELLKAGAVDWPWSAVSLRLMSRTARSGPRDHIARRTKTAAYFHTDLPYVAVNKDAFPTSPARVAGRITSHSACQNSTDFERDFSSAISGFRSLCGRKQRSLPKPSRSKGPAFWNLSPGGSRCENSGLDPYLPTGPVTLD